MDNRPKRGSSQDGQATLSRERSRCRCGDTRRSAGDVCLCLTGRGVELASAYGRWVMIQIGLGDPVVDSGHREAAGPLENIKVQKKISDGYQRRGLPTQGGCARQRNDKKKN